MRVIVDTSIIIAIITNEAEKRNLISLTVGFELIAPRSLHWELGNAFTAMFKRRRINLQQAKTAISEYNNIPVQFVNVSLEAALELANTLDIYAYDAYFLICAKQLNLPLLSLDTALTSKAKEIGLKIIEVEK